MTNHISEGVSAPARPAHALEKTGNGEGSVDLKSPLQTADIDAQLQRGCGADAHQRIIVLHLFFGALPVGGGEVAVMDQEAVRLMVHLAVLPETLADRLAFFPGIGEDETFFAPCMFKNIADAGIRCFRGFVGRRFDLR